MSLFEPAAPLALIAIVDIQLRRAMMNRDPFQRLPRPGWRAVLLAVACIGIGMLIQMLTGGDMVGGSVAAVFCVGAVMFLLSPKPSILAPAPTPARLRLLAWLFTGLAIAAAIAAVFIPWQPGSDFDLLGILFLLTNLIPLAVVCAALFFGSIAVSYWLRLLAAKPGSEQRANAVVQPRMDTN